MMKKESVTREKIDQLLRFLPLFDVPGESFILRWEGGTERDDGAITMPYPVYHERVEQFYRCAGQACWSDYEYQPAEAARMVRDDEFIAHADIAEIKTMLTYCVRGERFCDGHWGEMLRAGRIVAILKRLRVLRDQM
jgi:hypothetical protein